MGVLGVSVRKMKAMAVKVETVALVKVDRIWHALCIKRMKLLIYLIHIYYNNLINSNIFFLANVLLWWGHIKAWINTFLLCRHFLLGGCLRLESSCIQVNTVLLPSLILTSNKRSNIQFHLM
jgi:uncharacterized membrane protein